MNDKNKVKEVTVYICAHCGEDHLSLDEALECCPPEKSTRYRCPVCDELYDTEGEAASCHDEECIQRELGYCPQCNGPLRADEHAGKFCPNATCSEFSLTVH